MNEHARRVWIYRLRWLRAALGQREAALEFLRENRQALRDPRVRYLPRRCGCGARVRMLDEWLVIALEPGDRLALAHRLCVRQVGG